MYYLKYFFSVNKLIFHRYDISFLQRSVLEDQFRIESLSQNDLDQLERLLKIQDVKSEFDRLGAEDRLNKGYLCYAAFLQNEVIGYFWLAISKLYISYFDATLHMKPYQVCGLNAYVHPEYRGLGLFNMIKKYALTELKEDQYKEYIGYYFSWNTASMRSNIKFGSQEIGYVIFGYLLTFRFRTQFLDGINLEYHNDFLIAHKKLYQKITSTIK